MSLGLTSPTDNNLQVAEQLLKRDIFDQYERRLRDLTTDVGFNTQVLLVYSLSRRDPAMVDTIRADLAIERDAVLAKEMAKLREEQSKVRCCDTTALAPPWSCGAC